MARVTTAISVLLAVIGIVLIAETALVGGTIGYLFGALFILAGVLRGYLTILGRQR